MSAIHRATIKGLGKPPRAVFLDTAAGFGSIAEMG